MGLFSSRSSSSTTHNTDQSETNTIGGNESNVTSIKGDGNIVSVSDFGAVKKAFSFAEKSAEQAAKNQNDMFTNVLATVKDQNKLLSSAYQQGNAGDQVQLKYAGFAVVGLAVAAAAVIAVKKS